MKGSLSWKRPIIKTVCAVALAAILLLLFLPVGTRYYLVRWLEENGADSAVIDSLRYNPFTGSISLHGMEVLAKGQPLLSNASMLVDFGLLSLRQRTLHLEKAEYRDLSIDLEQYADGRWRIGTYLLPAPAGKADREAENIQEGPVAWAFLADRVTLAACRVHLKTPELQTILVIEEAELLRFTTREGQPAASLTILGFVDDSRVELHLESLQLVPEPLLSGKISVSGGKLATAAGFLRDVLPNFAGEVGLAGTIAFAQSRTTGTAVDYSGTLRAGGVDIGNNTFTSRVKNAAWQGRIEYRQAPDKPLTVSTDGSLQIGDAELRMPETGVAATGGLIDLKGKTSLSMDTQLSADHDGSLLLEGMAVQTAQLGVKDERMAWQGKVRFDSADAGPRVHVGGVLEATGLQAELVEPGVRFAQEKLEVHSNATLILGDPLLLVGGGSLAAEKTEVRQDDRPFLALDNLELTGMQGQDEGGVKVDKVAGSGFIADIAGSLPLQVSLQQATMESLTLPDPARLTADRLQLHGALAKSVHSGRELVRWQEFTLANIESDRNGPTFGAKDIVLTELRFLEQPADGPGSGKPVLALGRGGLSEISWNDTAGLRGGTLQLDDLAATIERDREGDWNFSEQLAAMRQAPGDSATTEARQTGAAPGDQALLFSLAKTTVGGASTLVFTDHTPAVPFATHLAISRLELGSLSTAHAEARTPFSLVGEFEGRAPLELRGDIAPFLADPQADLQLDLKNYPLAGLSPYVVQAAGTALADGRLRLHSSIKLADATLAMENALQLQQLETETIKPQLAAELDNQLPIPLDAALALLRDSDGNIKLDIPLSGPLRDLRVGISDVLVTALGQAIIPAASGYLMYALGPYGALAYVGYKVGEKLLQVRLPPLHFMPGEVALTGEHASYLERLAMILTDRPDTDMRLCPVVTPGELPVAEEKAVTGQEQGEIPGIIPEELPGAIPREIPGEITAERRDMLMELGQQRARTIRSHLVESHAIKQGRLLLCPTRIDEEGGATPAVIPEL